LVTYVLFSYVTHDFFPFSCCSASRSPTNPRPFPYSTLFRSGGPTAFPVPIPVERLPAGARVVDLVYPAPSQGLVADAAAHGLPRSEEHTSELQSRENLVCRRLLDKKKSTLF